MRNSKKTSKIDKIISLAENLPYFSFSDLIPVEKNKTYLKILFSRYEKKEKLFRVKKTSKKSLRQLWLGRDDSN